MGGRGCPPIANSCSCQATPLQADEIEVEQLLSLWVKCLALLTFVIWVFCSGCSGREIYCITCSWTKCFLDIRIATFQGQHGTSTYILQTSSNNFGYFCVSCAQLSGRTFCCGLWSCTTRAHQGSATGQGCKRLGFVSSWSEDVLSLMWLLSLI